MAATNCQGNNAQNYVPTMSGNGQTVCGVKAIGQLTVSTIKLFIITAKWVTVNMLILYTVPQNIRHIYKDYTNQ